MEASDVRHDKPLQASAEVTLAMERDTGTDRNPGVGIRNSLAESSHGAHKQSHLNTRPSVIALAEPGPAHVHMLF